MIISRYRRYSAELLTTCALLTEQHEGYTTKCKQGMLLRNGFAGRQASC